MNPIVWRSAAILIAIGAFIDPGFTRSTSSRPLVAVVAAGRADRTLVNDVVRELGRSYTVIEGELPGAAATVVAGDVVPESFAEFAAPVFAVFPARTHDARITAIAAPDRAPVDSRVAVTVFARVQNSNGDSLAAALIADDAVVDRAARQLTRESDVVAIPLWFVPATGGTQVLRARLTDGDGSAQESGFLVEANDRRWSVLFFDRRPSWMSTFVRRAIERDPRFNVTSRIITSRNVSTDEGRPPDSFDAVADGSFDVVVAGAPELLTERDVAGLESIMRRRGGSVVLLFDSRQDGRYETLTQVQKWSVASVDSAFDLSPLDRDAGTIKASQFAWPSMLPPGAERLVSAPPAARDSSRRAVIWRSAVGAGRLIVSGALDAWVYRDSSTSGFEAFWRRLLSSAADATPPAVEVRISPNVIDPSSRVSVDVAVREAALGGRLDDSVQVTVRIESEATQAAVRAWPTAAPGAYRATVRAPARPGVYRVQARAGAAIGTASFAVAPGGLAPDADMRDGLSFWVAAHGGSLLPRDSLSHLTDIMRAAVGGKTHAERWFPMRSAWWIIPFSLALGAEWFSRRRRGLA